LHFILGSASPRRQELLKSIGVVPDNIIAPDIDEAILKNELPVRCAERLAKEKATKVLEMYPEATVLTADTIVFCGRRVIDKTDNIDTAKKYLELLSGRRHRVVTSVFITNNLKNISKSVQTIVNFKSLNKLEIETYLESNEWVNVAGAYKIQGQAAAFIKSINGSYTNVVGLPLYEAKNMLSSIGYLD
jgi:septum formation protein|tara:strand:+ start:4081 stop:4647 length:567 start_codon:yes stop_codon:yes gene_type:complete